MELAALDAWAQVGTVTASSARAVRERARVPSPARVAELERTTNHDLAAFVDAVSSELGPEGRWFHYGLTSSDVLDTALALTVQDAGALIRDGIDRAFEAVVARAEEHRETITIGRTHGVHAEPTTFGLKLVGWAFELDRDRGRLDHALTGMRVGKLSGAVGTYATTTPDVERITCEALGLEAAPSSTQVLQRDRHAELLPRSRSSLPRSTASPSRSGTSRGPRCARSRSPSRTVRRGPRRCRTSATRSSRSGSAGSRASCADTRSSGWRTSPCGMSATSPTPRTSASCCPTRSSQSTTCSTASHGLSKGSSSGRNGCARISRRRAVFLQPTAPARARAFRRGS